MAKLSCQLRPHANTIHLQQLFTGFFLLKQRGLIQLSHDPGPAQRWLPQRKDRDHPLSQSHLHVLLNGTIPLHYDMHDGGEVDQRALEVSTLYFKRSYDPDRMAALGQPASKVIPLGLNYEVYPSSLDCSAFGRVGLAGAWKGRVLLLLRALGLSDLIGHYSPRIHRMQGLPDLQAQPRILFMVRAWDPYDNPSRSEQAIHELEAINTARAEAVRVLRAEFGDRFFGGFMHTDYARRWFPDCLLPESSMASKGAYIRRLASFPICVATTGLHGSIGWKFAEYVAFSKAILSEPLRYQVPGELAPERNYLVYESADQLVRQGRRLMADRSLRQAMMVNNARYYHVHQRPDSLVLNSLLVALSRLNPS